MDFFPQEKTSEIELTVAFVNKPVFFSSIYCFLLPISDVFLLTKTLPWTLLKMNKIKPCHDLQLNMVINLYLINQS